MKKTKVSNENSPPENAQEIIDNLGPENDLICSHCNKEIIETYYFICDECKNLKFCKSLPAMQILMTKPKGLFCN